MAKRHSNKLASAMIDTTPKKRTGKNAPSPDRKHKLAVGYHVVVNERAPRSYRGRDGFITEIGPGNSEYRVEFDDGRRPTTGYLMSPWLETLTS